MVPQNQDIRAAQPKVVEPEVVPAARPWPWAGKRTPPMSTYTPTQRGLMTFFYIVSVLMVAAIILVAVLTFPKFPQEHTPFRPGASAPPPVPDTAE